jgi:hypothetical protein
MKVPNDFRSQVKSFWTYYGSLLGLILGISVLGMAAFLAPVYIGQYYGNILGFLTAIMEIVVWICFTLKYPKTVGFGNLLVWILLFIGLILIAITVLYRPRV